MGRGQRRAALTMPSSPYAWLAAPAAEVAAVAQSLLGWQVLANGVAVRLTEVEAYAGVGEDPASHAHRGRTRRNAVMFGPAGFAYVYFVFGMHWCVNVTVGAEGEAAAVLLRAGEVVTGLPLARTRRGTVPRGTVSRGAVGAGDAELARGPARLAVVLGVDGAASGTSMVGGGPILLVPPTTPVDPVRLASGPRVGVAGGADTPYRFWIEGEASVSVYRRHVHRRLSGVADTADRAI